MANPKAFKYNERKINKATATIIDHRCIVTYFDRAGKEVAKQIEEIDLRAAPTHLTYEGTDYRLTIILQRAGKA